MGRGEGSTSSTLTRARARAGSLCSGAEFLAAEFNQIQVGEIVELQDGRELLIEQGDPALALKGLSQVDSVRADLASGPGHYRVSFTGGEMALVEVENKRVAFARESDGTPELIHAALYAAMAQAAMQAPESAPEAVHHLGDARAFLSDNPNDPEALRIFARAATALIDEDDQISVGDPDLSRRLVPEAKSTVLPRAQKRARLKRAQENVRRALQLGSPEPSFGLLYEVQANGQTGAPELEVDARREAALRLGGEHLIPEVKIDFGTDEEGNMVSIGEHYLGEQERTYFSLLRSRLSEGQRTFAFRGPPGSGKDSFIQQVAAIRRAPYIPFNIGPTYSFEDAIGGDGLAATEIRDDDGKLLTGVASSVQLEGPLARALREDAVVVIQEPEGMENEAVRLHSAAGDNVGDPTKRYLTINSSAGEISLPVHENCLLFFTYNSGEEDVRFKTALHDRMGNFDFEYPDEEEESRRYAQMVSKVMKHQTEAPELQRDFEPEEVMPIVKVMRRARNARAQNPETFVDTPGARQGVHCMCDLLISGYKGEEEPVVTMSTMLRYLLPGSELMSVEARDTAIRDTIIADSYNDLKDLASAAHAQNPKQAAEAKAKKKPAANNKPKGS